MSVLQIQRLLINTGVTGISKKTDIQYYSTKIRDRSDTGQNQEETEARTVLRSNRQPAKEATTIALFIITWHTINTVGGEINHIKPYSYTARLNFNIMQKDSLLQESATFVDVLQTSFSKACSCVVSQLCCCGCAKEEAHNKSTPAAPETMSPKTETTAPDATTNTAEEDGEVVGEVQVYILLGQSNMLGMGHVGKYPDDIAKDGTLQCAVHQKGLYPYLLDSSKNWATSPTVRNVRVMDGKRGNPYDVYHNEFMTIQNGARIGPEVGIGHSLERASRKKKPILLLKSCIGNRSLGWDLLPPGSPRYVYQDTVYAGYQDSPSQWPQDQPKPDPIDWYAGKQYDSDVAHCRDVLANLDTFYPGATKYKVAGFFWWQGDKDRYTEAYGVHYEANLVRLINQLRADFRAPDAKFVLATLGQTVMDDTKADTEQTILNAMMAVDGNSGKHPEFLGNVATVYSHPLSKGGASNGHYNGNAETYMNVGQAMGQAMAELVPNV